ncbi:hypothetical protein SDC9_184755 [bioreactor metagenome]|uniref:Uncharacterized protein n=1 Tax=bioreactor metagenome TaxID=1076179 RepID=A0A645HGE0_9ZZZZ
MTCGFDFVWKKYIPVFKKNFSEYEGNSMLRSILLEKPILSALDRFIGDISSSVEYLKILYIPTLVPISNVIAFTFLL